MRYPKLEAEYLQDLRMRTAEGKRDDRGEVMGEGKQGHGEIRQLFLLRGPLSARSMPKPEADR
jgi:hypothetical protein